MLLGIPVDLAVRMDAADYRTLAGSTLLAAGTVLLVGFVVAASQYPGYSATTQPISALGANAAPAGSQQIFTGVMVVAGGLMGLAAYGLFRSRAGQLVAAAAGVTGIVGLVAVGLFPMETGLPHTIGAAISFAGIGVTALLVAAGSVGPFAVVSAVMGTLELLAFVAFALLQGATPLDVGGLERIVAYLGLLWVTAYGGVLIGSDSTMAGPS